MFKIWPALPWNDCEKISGKKIIAVTTVTTRIADSALLLTVNELNVTDDLGKG